MCLPCALIWDWFRFYQGDKGKSAGQILSLLGFSLATLSSLLTVGTHVYALFIGGFPFYDPRLLRIYAWGALLSFAGVLTGIAGLWRSHPVRWLAPICSAGMFFFWLLSASAE
jgi:sulfite exporter TauE/SafE